jgi:hypothetical protein
MEPGSSRQGTFTVRRLLIAFALGAALLLPVGASADSHPNLILTVRLVPGTVSAGQPALAVAVFHNVGGTALPNVVVSLHFPKGFTITNAEACTAVPGSKVDVDCTLGDIPSGASKSANVVAVVDRDLPQGENVNVQFALRVGPGRPKPILTGASAQVLASTDGANRGSCLLTPRPLSAALGAQVTALPAPPKADPALNVPCTPLSVAVTPAPLGHGYNTNIASVGLPKLVRPAIVKLTFANETLPDESMIDNIPTGRHPSMDNPNPLWIYYPDTGKKFVVPRCNAGNQFPQGWHSCILKVIATDTGHGPNDDFDQGYITLLVQGAGFGDPRYLG